MDNLCKASAGYKLRPARRDDARRIAELYRAAADGVADLIWSQLALPGESIIESGTRRFARDGEDFSWENCMLAEQDGTVARLCHRYAVREASGPLPEDFDPVLRPFAELDVPGSLYVAGVSVDPAHRWSGLARALLAQACDQATSRGLGRLSALIFHSNAASRALFEGFGCEVIDRRTVPPHPLIERSGEILLYAGPVPLL